jgi:hypothetical protein
MMTFQSMESNSTSGKTFEVTDETESTTKDTKKENEEGTNQRKEASGCNVPQGVASIPSSARMLKFPTPGRYRRGCLLDREVTCSRPKALTFSQRFVPSRLDHP